MPVKSAKAPLEPRRLPGVELKTEMSSAKRGVQPLDSSKLVPCCFGVWKTGLGKTVEVGVCCGVGGWAFGSPKLLRKGQKLGVSKAVGANTETVSDQEACKIGRRLTGDFEHAKVTLPRSLVFPAHSRCNCKLSIMYRTMAVFQVAKKMLVGLKSIQSPVSKMCLEGERNGRAMVWASNGDSRSKEERRLGQVSDLVEAMRG